VRHGERVGDRPTVLSSRRPRLRDRQVGSRDRRREPAADLDEAVLGRDGSVVVAGSGLREVEAAIRSYLAEIPAEAAARKDRLDRYLRVVVAREVEARHRAIRVVRDYELRGRRVEGDPVRFARHRDVLDQIAVAVEDGETGARGSVREEDEVP